MLLVLILSVVVMSAAAVAVPARASAGGGATVFEYGTCITHLIQLFGPGVGTGDVVSAITTAIGPLTVVMTPSGRIDVILPPGRIAGGLEGCPVRSP
jgi:hypothetical protein